MGQRHSIAFQIAHTSGCPDLTFEQKSTDSFLQFDQCSHRFHRDQASKYLIVVSSRDGLLFQSP